MKNSITISGGRKTLNQGAGLHYLCFTCLFFASGYLSFTTGVYAWGMFDGFFVENSGLVSNAFHFFLTLLVVGAIDLGNFSLLAFSIMRWDKEVKDGKSAKSIYLKATIALFVIRLFASGGLTFMAREDVALFAVEDSKFDVYTDKINIENTSRDKRLVHALGEKNKWQNNEAARVRNVERKTKQLVKSAYSVGTIDQKRCWDLNRGKYLLISGRSNKKYRQSIIDAEKEGKALVLEEKEKTNKYESQYDNLLNNESSSIEIAALSTQRQKSENSRDEKIGRYSGYVWVVDILCMMLGCFFMGIPTLAKVEAGIDKNSKNFFSLVDAIMRKISSSSISRLEVLFNMDIDGDEIIGDPEKQLEATIINQETTTKETDNNSYEKQVEEAKKYSILNPSASKSVKDYIEGREGEVNNSLDTANPERIVIQHFQQKETVEKQLQSSVPQKNTEKQLTAKKTVTATIPIEKESIVLGNKAPVSQQKETAKKQVISEREKTVILVDSNQEVDKWKKYARTYFKRSQESATEKGRLDNRKKYESYKELLLNSGIVELEETKKRGKLTLSITDKK